VTVAVFVFTAGSSCTKRGISESDAGARAADNNGSPASCRATATNLRPDKARYQPGELVRLLVDVTNLDDLACAASVDLDIQHLDRAVSSSLRTTMDLGPRQVSPAILSFRAPADDFVGYMATVTADAGKTHVSAGLDVSSRPTVFPRYGFLSVFPPGQTTAEANRIVERLAQDFRINLFQFYDWSWRHEALVERNTSGGIVDPWNDLFGRPSSFATIRGLVDAVHGYGGHAMGYVTAYAAREDYERISAVDPAWGLYETAAHDQQVRLGFGQSTALYLFDPANQGWQGKMVEQYSDAVRTLGFDGVHIDQFGPRSAPFRSDGSVVDLPKTFPKFLHAIKDGLSARDPTRATCTFNLVDGSVGGWAVAPVATSNTCEALYSELWYTTKTYEEVRAYVEELRRLGEQRPAVLAGYSNYGEDIGEVHEAEDAERLGGRLTIATTDSGFSGSGYVERFDTVGQSLRWTIQAPQFEAVSLVFRYANATGSQASRTVWVDGEKVAQIPFYSRPAWTDWSYDAWAQVRVEAGAHVVELRYDQGDTGAIHIDRLTLGTFDYNSVLLANAVMFASGASHIEIGDDVQSLAHEYFPNRSKSLTTRLQEALTRQYSFMTAYENVLFGRDVVARNDRRSDLAVTSGQSLVTTGAGGLWTTVRELGPYTIVHLVNLIGVDDDVWRNSSPTPVPQTNIVVRLYDPHAEEITNVSTASPDATAGNLNPLVIRRGTDTRGGFVEVTVPRLEYWAMLLFRTGP
jgi:dextranase